MGNVSLNKNVSAKLVTGCQLPRLPPERAKVTEKIHREGVIEMEKSGLSCWFVFMLKLVE